MNAFKLASEARGPATVSRREPIPTNPAFYVAQLRTPAFRVPPSRARRQIAVQMEEPMEPPQVVKIIHTDSI